MKKQPYIIGISLLTFLTLSLSHCSRKTSCESFTVNTGERMGYSSFSHPNDTAVWSSCSDGKTRTLRCTTAHLSNWRCACSIDGVEKRSVRSKERFSDDRLRATSFANAICDWTLK